MLKNLTPRQIAIYAAGLIVAFNGLFLILFLFFGGIDWDPRFLLWIGLIGLSSYFSILFFVKKYIYRKIKLIYKSIHKFKLNNTNHLRK